MNYALSLLHALRSQLLGKRLRAKRSKNLFQNQHRDAASEVFIKALSRQAAAKFKGEVFLRWI
ncbi:hypothetical protein CRECT_0934 [Campylobacter rectus]|uniref:Uncharacterized protein n=1 Tax=Campylobacter rectus TaxID=203 RepID=A0A6G5QLL8_CAMRE|nr:hypothetical protein CRECT_0934 [Campylobacter rectus]